MTQAIEKNHSNNWGAIQEAAIRRLKESGELSGKNGGMVPLIKELVEGAIGGELRDDIKENKSNRRQGKTSKELKGDDGLIKLETSRDRGGSFEPELVKKRQTILGNVLQDKLLWLWALGLSYTDISGHIE